MKLEIAFVFGFCLIHKALFLANRRKPLCHSTLNAR